MNLPLRHQIETLRPKRERVDPFRPVAAWSELEPDGCGGTVKVAAIILAAAECPWRCGMCDLWKHTLTEPTPKGAIPEQIEFALSELPQDVRWIKLYNSGSFFDRRSIPVEDYPHIATLCRTFDRVIVENHPKLSCERIESFTKVLDPKLEIALGVETLQPGILRRLNKGMNRDDIDTAIQVHRKFGVDTRAFVLVRPPFTKDSEAPSWTKLTVKHLARLSVRHASLIPVRAGNGWLDQLAVQGHFSPPSIESLESAFEMCLQLESRPVVTVDLWDWPNRAVNPESSDEANRNGCDYCLADRRKRLETMNLEQTLLPPIECTRCKQLA